jgi:hypothetical protein
MCKNCYHLKGRIKLADKCKHTDRANYAHGVCKNCYLSQYHRERRAAQRQVKDTIHACKEEDMEHGNNADPLQQFEVTESLDVVGMPTLAIEKIDV